MELSTNGFFRTVGFKMDNVSCKFDIVCVFSLQLGIFVDLLMQSMDYFKKNYARRSCRLSFNLWEYLAHCIWFHCLISPGRSVYMYSHIFKMTFRQYTIDQHESAIHNKSNRIQNCFILRIDINLKWNFQTVSFEKSIIRRDIFELYKRMHFQFSFIFVVLICTQINCRKNWENANEVVWYSNSAR